MNRSYSKIRHMQESNLILERRLLTEESTPVDKINLDNGKENTIIEITNQSQVPQSLVDNPPPVAYYDSNRASHDEKGQYIDITDKNGVTYRLRNFDFNLAGHNTKGVIEAEYNSLLFQGGKNSAGKELIPYFNGVPGSEVVLNNKDKWIGFTSDDRSIMFACFSDKTGTFSCKEYVWNILK
jgi:hypothetical protein